MPLGASIVYGEGSSAGNGFRLKLRDLLQANGNNVSYVGSIASGTMTNNACEAYPGLTISEVDAKFAACGAHDYMPNIFLIHLGTNDCIAKRQDLATAPERFATLLSHLRAKDPEALVLMSSLVHNKDPVVDSCIAALNAKLQDVAQRASEGGQKTKFVDLYNAVPMEHISMDKTHPDDVGYDIMAQRWFAGLVDAGSLISDPDPRGKVV